MISRRRALVRTILLEILAAIDGQPSSTRPMPSELNATERKILASATDRPVPRKVLLRRAGLEPTAGGNRNAVTELVRRGLLLQVGRLFSLPVSDRQTDCPTARD